MARLSRTQPTGRRLRGLLAGLLLLLFTVAAASKPPTLLVFGDSISAAYGVAPGKGWVALLRARLVEHGFPHEVVNASISGEKTWRGRVRLPAALARHQPAVVVIQLGINDVMQRLPEGIKDPPLEVVRTRLTSMVELAHASGAHVLLLGVRLPARYGSDYGRRFEAVFREVADATGAALVPRALADAGERDVAERREWLLGGASVHPNARGHALMLENVWPELLPLLRATAKSVDGTSKVGANIRTLTKMNRCPVPRSCARVVAIPPSPVAAARPSPPGNFRRRPGIT